MWYLVTGDHPENLGSCVLVQNTPTLSWLFLEKCLYSFYVRCVADIVIMQIHLSFSKSYPVKAIYIPFSWLFCVDCLQVKLHSNTLATAVTVGKAGLQVAQGKEG